MSVGKPVFASRLTSLPEVGGDAARYFDSFDPDAMADTVRRGLEEYGAEPSRRDALVAHAARFTWDAGGAAFWEIVRDCGER